MKKEVSAHNAPSAVGPYSAAVTAQGTETVYVSGQLPIDPATGLFPSDDIREQTRQSITNIRNILQAAGMDLDDVVKSTVFLADISDFGAMNEIYGEFFKMPYPARCAFQVAALPKNARVEIEVTAVR